MANPSNATLTVSRGHAAEGFTVPNFLLTEFVQEPVYDEDNRLSRSRRRVIRGKGLFASPEAFADFQKAYCSTGTGTGTESVVNFTLQIRQAGGSWVTLAEYQRTVPDDAGGPHVRVSAPLAIGTRFLEVGVEIEVYEAIGDLPVAAHTWTQTCALGEDGRVEWTVRGMLRVAMSNETSGQQATPSLDGSVDEYEGKKPYADLFRLAVIPPVLGAGWRRKGYEFAYNADGSALAYQFTDQQVRSDLPYPAINGEMNFKYRANYPNVGQADVEARVRLEAPQGTAYRDLIACALNLTRVRVSPAGNILYSLEVDEAQLVDKVECTVVVGMRIFAQNAAGTSNLPLSACIGREFAITRADCNRTMQPYGDPNADPVWMVPYWVDNNLTTASVASATTAMPQATMITAELPGTCTTASVIVVSGSEDGMAAITAEFGGAFTNPYPKQPAGSGDAQTTILDSESVSVMEVDPGIVRMSSAQQDATDYVFQTQKPRVTVREQVVVSRQNQAPPRPMRPLPSGAMLVSEDWRVTQAGDPQGNMAFTGKYTRVFSMTDGGGVLSNGFQDATQAGETLRVWQPPNSLLLGARNPGFAGTAQQSDSSVFGDGSTDARLAWSGTVGPWRQA